MENVLHTLRCTPAALKPGGRPAGTPAGSFAFWALSGTIALAVQSPQPLVTRFSVDERLVATRTVSNAQRVVLPLGAAGWHLIALDVPRLLDTKPRRTGVRLVLG